MGIITGANGNTANVSTAGQLFIINPSVITTSGNPSNSGNYVTMVCEADAGTLTGFPLQRQADISGYYRQRVSIDTLIFTDRFAGTGAAGLAAYPCTNLWTTTTSGFTTVNATGAFNMNSTYYVTAGAYTLLNTYRTFQFIFGYTLQLEVQANYTALAVEANTVTEIGFGYASGVSTPTDGVFFRYTSAGAFNCVINYGGTEYTQSATLTAPAVNINHNYLIVINNFNVEFWVDNVLYANLAISSTFGAATQSNSLPILIRSYNSASSPSSGVNLLLFGVSVTLGDMNSGKPWQHIMAGCGNMSHQYPTGSGSIGTTAYYPNNYAAGAGAAASNTAAQSTLGLGGQWSIQPTLTAGTDGIISSFQVPIGSSTTMGKNLYLTGASVQGVVTTALTGGPCLMVYSIAFGSTNVNLQTVESATAKAPRRIPLAIETYAATAAIGVIGQGVYRTFNTPIFVQPGEFIQMIVKNVGTVTSAGVITYVIMFEGYWD